MWKNRIRAGNPACMGVTKTGRDVNFAVAVKDQKSCSLLLYRKGTDEPEQELEFSERTVVLINVTEVPAQPEPPAPPESGTEPAKPPQGGSTAGTESDGT